MAEVSIEQSDDLLIFRVTGSLSYDELVETYANHGILATKHIIWDFTNGTNAEIPSERWRDLTLITARLFPNRLKGSKTAFVAPRDVDFGKLNMYTALSKLSGSAPYHYQVFREFNEALSWIHNKSA